MTPEQQEILRVFQRLNHEIRWPTAKWLCSDLTEIIDSVVGLRIVELISLGFLEQGPGGWISLTNKGMSA